VNLVFTDEKHVHSSHLVGRTTAPIHQRQQTRHNFIKYESLNLSGYAGSYVCDVCRRPTGGLYYIRSLKKWVCGGCRRAVKATKRAWQEG
jgi:hypothetical protein